MLEVNFMIGKNVLKTLFKCARNKDFELIFSRKISEFEMGLRKIEKISIYCLANENTDVSYKVNRSRGSYCTCSL